MESSGYPSTASSRTRFVAFIAARSSLGRVPRASIEERLPDLLQAEVQRRSRSWRMGFKEDIIRKTMNDSSRIIQEIVKQQGEIQQT
jgi:hypothetical protein